MSQAAPRLLNGEWRAGYGGEKHLSGVSWRSGERTRMLYNPLGNGVWERELDSGGDTALMAKSPL